MNSPLFRELVSRLQGLNLLPDKPEETPESTLAALWHASSGNPVSVAKAARLPLPPLEPRSIDTLRTMVQRRLDGQPLAHITGRQEFMGLDFRADQRALIPRKETELLCNAALKIVHEVIAEQDRAAVIDVCTGAGNVGLSIAFHAPKARVYAADLSPEAISVATENRSAFGLDDRVELGVGDLFAPFASRDLEGHIDVVTCNPPYMASQNVEKMAAEISKYEPRIAFDGGPFGIGILGRVLSTALLFLRTGGWLCIEIGKGQGEPLRRLIERNKSYGNLQSAHDMDGSIRSLQMQKMAD